MRDAQTNMEEGGEKEFPAAPKDAGPENEPAALYKSETERVRYLARKAFFARPFTMLLWAVCHMLAYLLLDNLDALAYGLPFGYLAVYGKYLVMAPLLMALYGWLLRILKGEGLAAQGIAEGFPQCGSRGRRVRLLLCLSAVLYGGDAALRAGVSWLMGTALTVTGVYQAIPQMLLFHLQRIPALLLLQWLTGFFLTHAALTGWRRAFGLLSARGIWRKLLRVEARLLAILLPMAFVLYIAAVNYPRLSDEGHFALELLFQYGLCGLGLLYYPLSAIARFLLVQAQPRVALTPPQTPAPDFSGLDAAFAQRLAKRNRKPGAGPAAPYRSEAQRAFLRGRGIFRAHFLQCFLWGVGYMLAAYAPLGFSALYQKLYTSPLAPAIPYAELVLAPLALLMLYGWLHRLTAGEDAAFRGLLDPFRWIKARSTGRFLLIFLAAAAAYAVRGAILGTLAMPVYSASQPGLTDFSFLGLLDYFATPSLTVLWASYPLLYFPAFLLLTWAMDFLFIHAAQTGGRGALGEIHTLGIGKKVLLAEARLAAVFLILPRILVFAVLMIPGLPAPYGLVILLAPLLLLPVYHARSAVTRSLLVLEQPRATLLPPAPEPPACMEIDEIRRQETAGAQADEEAEG